MSSAAASTTSNNSTGHDDHHGGGPSDGTIISLVIVFAALGLCFGVGRIVPEMRYTPGGSGHAILGPEGIAVLHDGEVVTGAMTVTDAVLEVQTNRGLRVLPRAKVRWYDADANLLDATYWRRHGLAPLQLSGPEAEVSEPGLVGFVNGEVVTGFIHMDAHHVQILHPYRVIDGDATDPVAHPLERPRKTVLWFETASGREELIESVDPAQAEQTLRSELETEAVSAQARGAWRDAAAAWGRLVCQRLDDDYVAGFAETSGRVMELPATQDAPWDAVQALHTAVAPRLSESEALRDVLAERAMTGLRFARMGNPGSDAHALSTLLIELDRYTAEAEQTLRELRAAGFRPARSE